MCFFGSMPEARNAAVIERVWSAQVLVDELRGQRMQVDDAVDAVVAVLQRDEVADGAEIVAEMQIAGRLDAGKDERLEGGHCCSLGLWRAVSRAAKVFRRRAYGREWGEDQEAVLAIAAVGTAPGWIACCWRQCLSRHALGMTDRQPTPQGPAGHSPRIVTGSKMPSARFANRRALKVKRAARIQLILRVYGEKCPAGQ